MYFSLCAYLVSSYAILYLLLCFHLLFGRLISEEVTVATIYDKYQTKSMSSETTSNPPSNPFSGGDKEDEGVRFDAFSLSPSSANISSPMPTLQ